MRLSACVLGLGFALFHPFLLGDGANIGTVASANEATWSSFDLGKARAILSEFEISDLDLAEAVYEWENLILRAQRASASDEILKKLREQQKHWRSMSVQMKKQLEDVITRAKKDAKIRLVAKVLKMGAMLASAVQEWNERELEEEERTAKEGQTRLREERYLEKYEDGKWRVLQSKKLWIQGRTPSGLEDSNVTVMRIQLEEWSKVAPALLCNVKQKACFVPDVDLVTERSMGDAETGSKGGDEVVVVAPGSFDPLSKEIVELAQELDLEFVELASGVNVVEK